MVCARPSQPVPIARNDATRPAANSRMNSRKPVPNQRRARDGDRTDVSPAASVVRTAPAEGLFKSCAVRHRLLVRASQYRQYSMRLN